MEKVLSYSRQWVTQNTGWYCGPASTQTVILGKTGKLVPEDELARDLRTTVNGTDYIGFFPAVLNRRIGGGWRHQDIPGADASPAEVETLWDRLRSSIDSGFGVIANFVVPPSNYPRAVAPSTQSPAYGGGTVYHYVACMGYGEDSNGRRVWIADSGFSPYGYWMSLRQFASCIAGKGYAYATARVSAPKPAPARKVEAPSGGTIFGVDVSEHQDGMSLKKAASEGVQFAIVRTTDGTYKDRCYQSHIADAEQAGLVTAAYHYLRNPSEGTTVAQQVQASLDVMGDKKRPVWIDVETSAGLHVNDIRACKREFEKRGVRVIGCYSYVPYWEGRISPSEPDSHEFGAFWVAAYGTNPSGAPKAIYPGDSHRQWSYPLGNQKPVLWQFGSKAQVAGYNVDINAFKGSKEQLRALFYGGVVKNEGDDMTDFDQINRRFKSRVPGSNVQMRPLDALLNVDAHAFITKLTAERMEKKMDAILAKLEGK